MVREKCKWILSRLIGTQMKQAAMHGMVATIRARGAGYATVMQQPTRLLRCIQDCLYTCRNAAGWNPAVMRLCRLSGALPRVLLPVRVLPV